MARSKRSPRRGEDVDDAPPRARTPVSGGHVFDLHPQQEFLTPLTRWAQRSVAGHSKAIDG